MLGGSSMQFHHRWAGAVLFGVAFALSSAANAASISYTSASRTLDGYASCDSCLVAPYADTHQDNGLNPWADAVAGSYVLPWGTASSAAASMDSSALTPTGFAADLWASATGYASSGPGTAMFSGIGQAAFVAYFTLDATTQLRLDFFGTNVRNNINPSYTTTSLLQLDLRKGSSATDLSGINDDLLGVHQNSVVTLGPGNYTFLAINKAHARSGNFGYSSDEPAMQFSVTTVPVPAAAWLFGSGLAGLIGFARCR